MITGSVKNKVDQIWTNIWAGGITNPLTVIEQLTYLMFIRSLDVKEIRNEKMENLTGITVPHIMILPLSVTSTFFFILNVRKIRPTSIGEDGKI